MRRHEPNKPLYRDSHGDAFVPMGSDRAETHEELQVKLGGALLNAAQRGDPWGLKKLIEMSAPVNFQDARTGATALHYVAAYRARAALRVLLNSDQCDFLIRDKAGRFASEMAGVYGRDPAVAKLLRMKERAQADAQGVRLRRRAPREMSNS